LRRCWLAWSPAGHFASTAPGFRFTLKVVITDSQI
jgi:hypothetical protein